jgi:beta-lactamase regulating signal transducer with metallopeptidase domain/tetratricopeptide (TPR) repeat protein
MIAHLAACSAVAVVAVAATLLLRGQRAAWRHAILFVALMRFAVPTEWLSEVGRGMVKVAPARLGALEGLGWLLTGPGGRTTPRIRGVGRPAGLPYEAIWMIGVGVCLALWTRRARRRIPAVRAASGFEAAVFARAAGAVAAELRIVAGDLAPGAWGFLRPVVLLPDGLSAELTGAELEAVLAHEVAHAQRRDNLLAAMAHAVVCVFWFHPLVWWMERRMLAERETACDELVLSQGTPARDYATGILKVCRMSFAGAAGYAGVNGSNLKLRMEHIMSVDLNRTSSRAARALLAVLLALVAMVPACGGYLQAQQQQQQVPPPMARRTPEVVEMVPDSPAARTSPQADSDPILGVMRQVESLMGQGRQSEALELLRSEVKENPKRTDLRLSLGNVAVRAGKYDLAVATFQEILAQLPEESTAAGDLYLRLGETYRRMGDLGPAVAALQHARALLPDNIVVINVFALVLDAAGRSTEAEREYRKAIELDPRNGVSMNNLAYLLSRSAGHLNEALDFALQAHELLPDMYEVEDTVGWVHLKMNHADQAIEMFDQLVRKQPQHSTYRYHLAMAFAQKGYKASAVEQLKAALECSPGQEEADKIRQLLNELQQ